MQTLNLGPGLELRPPQTIGNIRLVPVLRRDAPGDIRLAKPKLEGDLALVATKGNWGPKWDVKQCYASFVPHAAIVSFTKDGTPAAVYGTKLHREGKKIKGLPVEVQLLHRMVQRQGDNAFRMLPLHLAMQGFLSDHFGGPPIAWKEWSDQAVRFGLSPRIEYSVKGRGIQGLEQAARLFEIQEDQVGALLFVQDMLASAFVLPHPDDYRAAHDSIVQDFFGELIWMMSRMPYAVGNLDVHFEGKAQNLEDLALGLDRMRRQWADFITDAMSADLLGRPVSWKTLRKAGRFELRRFITDLRPGEINHIGEAIVRKNGRLEYLASYQLSAAQTKRAYLLDCLSQHNWNLAATAVFLRQSNDELVLRLHNAQLGHLLRPHVIEEARRRTR